jgi:two-component system sensor histidine kinase RpfC
MNPETIGQLEQLGSAPGFFEKVAGVFLSDIASILSRMEQAIGTRSYGEFRAHLHALKGSSASMGADRITRLCTLLGKHSDAELRLQGPGILRSLSDEIGTVTDELNRYLRERKKSAM